MGRENSHLIFVNKLTNWDLKWLMISCISEVCMSKVSTASDSDVGMNVAVDLNLDQVDASL